jgi:hypothetical protein
MKDARYGGVMVNATPLTGLNATSTTSYDYATIYGLKSQYTYILSYNITVPQVQQEQDVFLVK